MNFKVRTLNDGTEVKLCTGCGVTKRITEFGLSGHGSHLKITKLCLVCTSYYNQQVQYRRRYGIQYQDYLNMCKDRSNKCDICGKEEIPLNIDHDHKTQAIRGLLCTHCNRSLGAFGDNIEGIEKVLVYLKKAPKQPTLLQLLLMEAKKR